MLEHHANIAANFINIFQVIINFDSLNINCAILMLFQAVQTANKG